MKAECASAHASLCACAKGTPAHPSGAWGGEECPSCPPALARPPLQWLPAALLPPALLPPSHLPEPIPLGPRFPLHSATSFHPRVLGSPITLWRLATPSFGSCWACFPSTDTCPSSKPSLVSLGGPPSLGRRRPPSSASAQPFLPGSGPAGAQLSHVCVRPSLTTQLPTREVTASHASSSHSRCAAQSRLFPPPEPAAGHLPGFTEEETEAWRGSVMCLR